MSIETICLVNSFSPSSSDSSAERYSDSLIAARWVLSVCRIPQVTASGTPMPDRDAALHANSNAGLLDFFWSRFFVSGDPKYIQPIISFFRVRGEADAATRWKSRHRPILDGSCGQLVAQSQREAASPGPGDLPLGFAHL